MIVCEYEFMPPHDTEVDCYNHLPYTEQPSLLPQHRLTLRRNQTTGDYEVYRAYDPYVEKQTGVKEEVAVATKSLGQALGFMNREVEKHWGAFLDVKDNYRLCQHEPPLKRHDCDRLFHAVQEAKERVKA